MSEGEPSRSGRRPTRGEARGRGGRGGPNRRPGKRPGAGRPHDGGPRRPHARKDRPPPPRAKPPATREEALERLLKGVRIVHEDEHLLVVDKPPGLATVPRGGPPRRGKAPAVARSGPQRTRGDETAWLAVKRYLRERGREPGREGAELPELRVVNDLDPLASGLLVIAKGESFEMLREQRSRGKLGRIAYVVVRGQPRLGPGGAVALEGTVRVEEQVGTARGGRRNPRSGSRMPARARSVAFRLVAGGERHCLLRMRMSRDETWIMHRAVEGLGCEIARMPFGPPGRGGAARQRLMLHLGEIVLEHPATRTRERYTSPPPGAFERLVRGGTAVGGVGEGGKGERRGRDG